MSAPRAVAGNPRIRKPRAASPADEFSFMHELLFLLNRLPGVRAWRQNVGTVRTGDGRMFHAGPPRGASDIVGIVAPEGWFLSIECKAGKGKRTAAQEAWAEMIGAAGGIYLCLHAREGVEASIGAVRAVIEGRRRDAYQAAEDMAKRLAAREERRLSEHG